VVDLPEPYRVAARRRETHDTVTLALEPAGEPAGAFSPGQFAMLYAWGAGDVPISVSGGTGVDGRLVHTVRAVGAVTERIVATPEGGGLGVRGPYGTAWPVGAAEGRDVVLVAGGIGLAPLRPVIHHVLAARERYGRLVVLYGGRSPAELLYRDELAAWGARDDLWLGVTVDTAQAGWAGRVGVVTTLVAAAPFDPARAIAMLCGPEVMMRFAAPALRERGLPGAAIHLSLERSMKCGVGHCGHCQLGPLFVCKDGPVLSLPEVEGLMAVREL
jgi:NAD(P)H-flavin reductase